MIARFVSCTLLGLMVGVPQDRAEIPEPAGTRLVLMAPLSDGLETVFVTEHPGEVVVSLAGPSVPLYFGLTPKPLPPEDFKVWLLKKDGTAVAPLPGFATGAGRSTSNRGNLILGFKFEHVAPDALAGVVVSIKGKLLVREIRTE